MSKFVEVFEETQQLFNEVLNSTSIPEWVTFKLLSDNNQSELYQVKKLSELFEILTDGISIVIIINESVFDMLDETQKKIVFEEALCGVNVNFQTDKLSIEKFDFTTYSSMLNKYGDSTMIGLKENIKSIFDKIAMEQSMEKSSKKNAKK